MTNMEISTVFLDERASRALLGEVAVGIVPAERDGAVGGRGEDVVAVSRGGENVFVGLELDHLHVGLVLRVKSEKQRDSFALRAEVGAESDVVLVDGELEDEGVAALESDGILEVRLAENRLRQLLVPKHGGFVEGEGRERRGVGMVRVCDGESKREVHSGVRIMLRMRRCRLIISSRSCLLMMDGMGFHRIYFFEESEEDSGFLGEAAFSSAIASLKFYIRSTYSIIHSC